MKKIIAITIIIAVVILGCSKYRTIDGSTEESFQASIEKIRSSLKEERRIEFDKALNALLSSEFGDTNDQTSGAENSLEDIRAELDGKNTDWVIVEGNLIYAEMQRSRLEKITEEIYELKAEKAEIEASINKVAYALKGIKGFKVINSRYFLKENGGLKEPVFELTVVNNTQYVVSRAYFECELGLTNGPDGSLFVFEFDYEIPGGLEPGKIEKRQLPQSSLNEVPDVLKDKNSTNLRVIPARIDGLDGEPIYDIKEYPKHNLEYYKERLDYITSRFEDLLVSMQQIEDEMREASKN